MQLSPDGDTEGVMQLSPDGDTEGTCSYPRMVTLRGHAAIPGW